MILNFILHINLIDEKGKFDEMIEDKGVKILIDPKALMHVIGTKMDFVDDKLRYNTIFLRVIYLFFCLGELGEGEGLGGQNIIHVEYVIGIHGCALIWLISCIVGVYFDLNHHSTKSK